MSQNESAFFNFNRSYKGIQNNSEKTKFVIRVAQEKCFNTQKQAILNIALNKKNFNSTTNALKRRQSQK